MSIRPSFVTNEFAELAEMLDDKGYLLGSKIGSGTYSQVRLVKRKSDGKTLVTKIINIKSAAQDYVETFLPRELDIMVKVHHEHIASVEEIIHIDDWVFVIMEYAAKGDMMDFITNKGAMSEQEAKRAFRQMAMAVDYLHENNIIHRDIKCENILIKENGDIIVSDFGFSRTIKDNELCRTYCGSCAYACPQIIRGIPYDGKGSDVWGMGCVLFVMLFGKMPFDDISLKRMIQSQDKGISLSRRVANPLPESCKCLLKSVLEPDQTKRYTTKDILNSEWLKEGDK
ncbi:testis-specific serine/threonine-protein kinase 3-like [Gigantopelta aegis]|uniref:testis-specific serine/threonine-protein kinase 3-like n=1 Tax=Gigantopelta aegis TaxID=1735272 RepID=UPI001B889533|nr:testis-specific serine/threonine-protein kinase 3-like [Gigantopelta aegis]